MKAPRLDRSAFAVGSVFEDSDERRFWQSKTPAERIEALEMMRQAAFGYDPIRTRLQRILAVASLGGD